ncbi:MAG: ferrous iron transport protein B [Spirochaetaceae bacterium]|nr:ferrous iron transport protein B [Spirochaetaceae bacterium]
MTDKNEIVVALLGQPNSGKSTLFNALTGLKQHVGNWPGKTVEKRYGSFTHGARNYQVVDLPGSYSLTANSDEEVITRDFITSGKADVVCILADSSQLERSLYMLADYAGIKVPCFLVLNMKDVAESQGKKIDAKTIEQRLQIPTIFISAPNRKDYESFYAALDYAYDEKTILDSTELEKKYKEIENEDELQKVIHSGEAKFDWIDSLLDGAVTSKKHTVSLGKLDKIYTHKFLGKAAVVLTIIVGLLLSFIPAIPPMALGSAIGMIPTPLHEALIGMGCPEILSAFITDVLIRSVGFIVQMLGFVFGVTLVFGFFEEVGIMARISYVFDNTMSKLGLQGKSVMPFLVSFGCTMGGAAGTRVIDNWGQKVLTIALAWAVPCGAAWAIIPMLSTVFFGAWMPLIIIVILFVMVLHMWITAKVFSPSLVKKEDRYGMIMELPPYHKPKLGQLLRYVLGRTKDTFFRVVKVVLLVATAFWLLSYSTSSDVSGSILYSIGRTIEPVTKLFGMGWQTFMAFIASSLGKEGALGVLSTIYNGSGAISINTVMGGSTAANINELLIANVSKPEALALIFAMTFNMPCIVALAATYQETHSAKWTFRIAIYYTVTALLLAGVANSVGCLIW